MAECWARCLGGCGGKISGEHIVTESLWEGDRICVQGFQWCRPTYKEISVRNFTSNILCERHNSLLSDIGVDGGGTSAFDVFRQVAKVHDQRLANIEAGFWTGRFDICEYSIDGSLVERWLLKTLINMELSGDQGLTLGPYDDAERPHCDLVKMVYGLCPFPGSSGLYLVEDSSPTLTFLPGLRYLSHLKKLGSRTYVAAGGFWFRGFQFLLSLEPEGLSGTAERCDAGGHVLGTLNLLYHPQAFDFRDQEFPSQTIRFTW